MLTIDPARRTPRQLGWTVWLAMLGLAGAWQLAATPAGLLRQRWDATLVWLFTLACCGVVAEATWNDGAHRRKATLGLFWGTLLIWGDVIHARGSDALAGAAMMMVLLPLTLSALLLVSTSHRP